MLFLNSNRGEESDTVHVKPGFHKQAISETSLEAPLVYVAARLNFLRLLMFRVIDFISVLLLLFAMFKRRAVEVCSRGIL